MLVGGGSRSGKTRFALQLARECGRRLAYVATAELLDQEMRERAFAHRAERGDAFTTIEEPRELPGVIRDADFDAIVVDCLTIWVSNLLHAGAGDVQSCGRSLVEAAAACPARVILVTNEVGCGIVPDNELARRFRDEAGWMNQMLASRAEQVWWLVFGCPLKVKG
ncbi:MAG: bifunctional adenosylcobinamide kinase/adenosylcobinamide-phosphate guanylyltransferase [Acidobacteria bacterium]|nr:bifunctional adenosylcobinamide kinase/adenosylcobinamide-phosphate guanylyltransferase [Acidobacteriota bacterium]